MARTRAREHPDALKPEHAPEGPRRRKHTTANAGDKKKTSRTNDKKRKLEEPGGEETKNGQTSTSKKSKITDATTLKDTPKSCAVNISKLDSLLSSYGVLPLEDTRLPKHDEPTPETVLSLLYLAMLTSARISHKLAYKSVRCLIEAGYQDIKTLKKNTWQERTEVLTKGGYTRYREKTATALGELAGFIEKEYGA